MFKNLSKYKKIYFVGIGGISMSALALLLKSEGHIVCGSDSGVPNFKDKMIDSGIEIFDKPNFCEIESSDLLCYTGAVRDDDEEKMYAISHGIDTMERSTLLGLISHNYDFIIAVSGSHGKTTITSLLGFSFMLAGRCPTVHVGGNVRDFSGNLLLGEKTFFITEACEYRDSFLTLKPNVSIVSNIDKEHLDYFLTYDNEINSFKNFVQNTKSKAFIHNDYLELLGLEKIDKISTYCSESDDKILKLFEGYIARNLVKEKDGKYSFDVYCGGEFVYRFKLNLYGRHNVDNALSVIAVCRYYNIDNKTIFKALSTFSPVESRFEEIGRIGDSIAVCDYAHHPSEIDATLRTCIDVYNGKRIVCLFQPHTYSRTRTLFKDFLSTLSLCDTLVILPTYPARETYDYYGSARRLYNRLKQKRQNTYYSSFKNLPYFLKKLLSEDTIFLFLGAGNIQQIAKNLCKNIV